MSASRTQPPPHRHEILPQTPDRLMCRSLRPEPVGTVQKILLVDGFQNYRDRPWTASSRAATKRRRFAGSTSRRGATRRRSDRSECRPLRTKSFTGRLVRNLRTQHTRRRVRNDATSPVLPEFRPPTRATPGREGQGEVSGVDKGPSNGWHFTGPAPGCLEFGQARLGSCRLTIEGMLFTMDHAYGLYP